MEDPVLLMLCMYIGKAKQQEDEEKSLFPRVKLLVSSSESGEPLLVLERNRT